MDADEGDTVELGEVLLVGGDDVQVGQPHVEGAVVVATVLGDVKAKKLTVLRYKPKSRRLKRRNPKRPRPRSPKRAGLSMIY